MRIAEPPKAAAPAAISPIPKGSATPDSARIAPNANVAPPTIPPYDFNQDWIVVYRRVQLIVTVVASPTAPATISPIPNGSDALENASIAPIANKAVLTPAVISAAVPVNLFFSQSQLSVATAPVTPAANRPTPSGTFTPVNARIAPSAIEAALIAPTTPFAEADTLPVRKFQFKPIAAARLTAPAAIIAIPRGALTPENAIIAPNANSDPPITASTAPIASFTSALSPSQFMPIMLTKPEAPAAIRERPSGTFTPLNVRIAPTAKVAPLTIRPIRDSVSFSDFSMASEKPLNPPESGFSSNIIL